MASKDEPYSTFYVENLLSGLNEWRNIQDIVRMTFKALCEVVRSQGISLREIEKQLSTKASKSELNSGLNLKANVADVMRTFSEVASNIDCRPTNDEIQIALNERITKSDLQYHLSNKPNVDEIKHLVETKISTNEFNHEINNLNLRIEEFTRDFNKRVPHFALNKDLSNLAIIVENKANINDVNDALNTKASKDSVINALHRKANKNEIESILNTKLDISEFQVVIKNQTDKFEIMGEIDKINSILDTKADKVEISSIFNNLNSKAELKDFDLLNINLQEVKRDISKRVDDIDSDLDRLIENIRKEFQNINSVINNIDLKKVDFKDFDKLSSNLSKKMDNDIFNSSLTQIKNEIYESFGHYKNDLQQNKKVFEDHLNEKIIIIEKNLDKSYEDLNRIKEKFNESNERRKVDYDEIMKQLKNFISNFSKEVKIEQNLIRTDIEKLGSDLDDQSRNKVDRKEFESLRSKFLGDLEHKSDMNDLENLFKNIQNEIQERIEIVTSLNNQQLKNFENDFNRLLDKKANLYEVTTMLNGKADIGSMNVTLQSKISIQEFESLKITLERMNKDILNKIDYDRFEIYANEVRQQIESIEKELSAKSNSKENSNLLKNKADIDDVNKALTQIHDELDAKCGVEQFNSAMDNQTLINEALCAENCVARWIWKSGQVKNGYAIPWEIQTVNTAPDNYLWEKEKTSVMVVSPGLYEISLGFYSNKKPTVQLLINGEPILSAVNTSAHVIHHSSGKLKNVGKHSGGNITGLTMIDFIAVPERARVSISYSGEEGAEGFLSLKKL